MEWIKLAEDCFLWQWGLHEDGSPTQHFWLKASSPALAEKGKMSTPPQCSPPSTTEWTAEFWFNLLRLLTPVNHWFKHTCRPSQSYARLTWHSYVCLVRPHMSHWTRIDCHGGVMNVPGHEVTDCGDKHFYCCCWWCPAPHRCPFLSCQIYSTSIPLSTIVVPHNTTEGALSARTTILSLFQFHTPESKACATGSWHNIHMGTAHWFSLKSWECAHLFRHWR